MIFTSRLHQRWKIRKLQNEPFAGKGQRVAGAPQGGDIAVHERSIYLENTMSKKLIPALGSILILACGVSFPQATLEPIKQNPDVPMETATAEIVVTNTMEAIPTLPPKQDTSAIVGTWNFTLQWLVPYDETIYTGKLTFNPDGTGSYSNEKTPGQFTWTTENDRLTWVIVGSDATYIATFVDGRIEGTMSGSIGAGPDVASGTWAAYR
jgi:hypothetical protein